MICSPLAWRPLRADETASRPVYLVRQVLEDLHAERAGRQVEIMLGESPLCWAEPSLLKQVFVNLLTNAFEYSRQRESA